MINEIKRHKALEVIQSLIGNTPKMFPLLMSHKIVTNRFHFVLFQKQTKSIQNYNFEEYMET